MDFTEIVFTVFMVGLFVGWIVLVIAILVDIIRSTDLAGGAKAGWVAAVILLPWIGVIAYLTVRGSGMRARRYARGHPSSGQDSTTG